MQTPSPITIAVIGGTGQEGQGLTLRRAAAGPPVIIGSRQRQKAEQKAADLNAQLAGVNHPPIRGLANREAAASADVIALVVPYAAQHDILAGIRDAAQARRIY